METSFRPRGAELNVTGGNIMSKYDNLALVKMSIYTCIPTVNNMYQPHRNPHCLGLSTQGLHHAPRDGSTPLLIGTSPRGSIQASQASLLQNSIQGPPLSQEKRQGNFHSPTDKQNRGGMCVLVGYNVYQTFFTFFSPSLSSVCMQVSRLPDKTRHLFDIPSFKTPNPNAS